MSKIHPFSEHILPLKQFIYDHHHHPRPPTQSAVMGSWRTPSPSESNPGYIAIRTATTKPSFWGLQITKLSFSFILHVHWVRWGLSSTFCSLQTQADRVASTWSITTCYQEESSGVLTKTFKHWRPEAILPLPFHLLDHSQPTATPVCGDQSPGSAILPRARKQR